MKNLTIFLINFLCLSYQMIMPARAARIKPEDSWSNATRMLFDGISKNKPDLVINAIRYGADVSAIDNYNWTPLIHATYYGKATIVQILVKNNTNVNATTSDGYTALMFAANQGYPEIVSFLINHKADVNAKSNNSLTALRRATINNHTEIVRILLKNNANVNATISDESTALMDATSKRYTEIVCMLLAAGANPDISNIDGQTARQINPKLIDEAILANRNTVKELQALPPFLSEIKPNVEIASIINAMFNSDPDTLQNLNKIKDWLTNEEFETEKSMKLL